MLILLFQRNFWLWDWFIYNPQIKNAGATAESWFYLSLIISFVFAVLVFFIKLVHKRMSPNPGEGVWKRKATWQLIVLGLLPVLGSLWAFWYVQDDYYKVLQFPGLVVTSAGASLPYVVFIAVFHLIFGWRRELI
jgi:hypothetical protein